jgi:hypothetical protein
MAHFLSVVGGHCEAVAWWAQYAVDHGVPLPSVDITGEPEAMRPDRPVLELRADTGCLHAHGWRTPLCVQPACVRYAFAPAVHPDMDECTNPYGCGQDHLAV